MTDENPKITLISIIGIKVIYKFILVIQKSVEYGISMIRLVCVVALRGFWKAFDKVPQRRLLCKLSQCIRFPTMWYVRPAKPQISLRIRAV